MAIVTEAQLKEYTGNHEDSTLNSIYIDFAEGIVKDYLGYDPIAQDYTEYFSGIGDDKLYLNAQPVIYINNLTIDGEVKDVEDYAFKKDCIYKIDHEKVFTEGVNNIIVGYSAGYDELELPGIIQLSVLRIASLLLQESGGNIGITGKSFGENSRSFINYADYKKYLKPLDGLRIIRV